MFSFITIFRIVSLGMPHGLLFMGYIILAFMLKKDMNWTNKTFGFVLLASITPFGTFYIDRKYLKTVHNE